MSKLEYAIKKGDISAIRELLRSFPLSINERAFWNQNTPLHTAVKSGNKEIM